MKITDLINKKSISLNAKVNSKSEAIDKLVELMNNGGNIKDIKEYKRCVLAREAESTTGIGEEIAIPHAKTSAVIKPGLSAMVVRDGVDFDSLDGAPVKLFFLIAAPNTEDNVHLDVLSRLSTLLMDENFKNNLIKAKSADEFLDVVNKAENAKLGAEEEKKKNQKEGARILAVTACPTGIAHTYMAAESLENTAKSMGISIKVETNGSGGAKNVLTSKDIQQAECIIIAADKKVEMARFDGKRVIQVKVADGINKAGQLIERAVNGDGGIYHAKAGESAASDEKSNESFGRQIYKHLMNGVSHMLPFVIGGGILIALSFLLDTYDPNNASAFGTGNSIANFFSTTGHAAFDLMLAVLAGYIAMSIGDRPALAVGFAGGIIANAGGSGFLGALFAGFAAGYITVGLKRLFDRLPKALEGTKPVLLYPFFGVLIIGLVIIFIINPPVAVFNNWLNVSLNRMGSSSKFLLGLILGGMMSIDFGGPLNKAAYVFGTAQIEAGNYDIMAAVMIGGMVPPIAIALCTIFFKNRFTERERQSGVTNIVMGLSFITEGAIPFAASDPLRVIPACAIGSAVAGGLSMVFGCGSMAPHGGIFVIPIITNPIMFLAALAIGAIVGTILLAILKKPLTSV